ncbi:MAG TPA: hypothetical protein VN436_01810, partial [Holophaga sp.]|nr:hypothetical protein [Holophaga sp.]
VAAQRLVGPGKSVGHLVRKAPADVQWISCGNYFQGIPFYSGQRVTVLAGTGELAFGKERLVPSEQLRWFPEDVHALGDVARRLRAEAPARPVWAIVARHAWNDLAPGDREAWDVVDRVSSAVLVRLK